MQKNKIRKLLNFVSVIIIFIAILSFFISYVFTPNFVEKFIDADQRIGEHVKSRVTIFQDQMFFIACIFSFFALLILFFRKKVLELVYAHQDFFKKLVFLLVFLLVLSLIGEVVLRLFFADMIYNEFGHGPGSLKLNKQTVYNTLGYRDVEHSLVKGKDTYRVLILGDSLTFGSGVWNSEKIYSKLIEHKINEKYGYNKVETIVMTKGGYSTLDELKVFKEKGLKFNPDLVVVGYFLNDAEGEGSRAGYEKMFYFHFSIPYEAGSLLYERSFLYYLFESRMNWILINTGIFGNNLDYTKHLYSNSNPYFDQHKKDLKELIKVSKEQNIPILIIMIPSLQVDLKNYSFDYVNKEIEKLSKENGAYYLDLLPYFQNYGASELAVSFLDAHMNELGHEVTAKAIIDYLEKKF